MKRGHAAAPSRMRSGFQSCVSPRPDAAPEVERVIDRHARLELLAVVGESERQPERDGEQAGSLRRKIMAVGVGRPHDQGQLAQAGRLDAEAIEKRVEAASLADMAEFDVRYVEGDGLHLAPPRRAPIPPRRNGFPHSDR